MMIIRNNVYLLDRIRLVIRLKAISGIFLKVGGMKLDI